MATELLKKAGLPGRNPWAIAAAALCWADETLAGKEESIGKEITRAADCGRSNLSATVAALKAAEEKERSGRVQSLKLWPSGHSTDFVLVVAMARAER